MLLLPFRCYCSKPRSITWPPSCRSCLDMYLSIWKTFTRQGCVNTVATIRQSGKCVQGCYSVFSFLWIPLPSNLMHFLCKRAFESKDRRERDLSQKNTEAITSTTSVTTCRERRLYIWAKMCWHYFAIGGEGKGPHSPESKYVAIRITASANTLLQMELPTTHKEQAGHNHNYHVFNNFRGDEIARQSLRPLLELLPGQRNPKKYNDDVLQNSAF